MHYETDLIFQGKVMPTCLRCNARFDETEPIEYNPIEELGAVFIETIGNIDFHDLCPACREKLGIFSLLAFNA